MKILSSLSAPAPLLVLGSISFTKTKGFAALHEIFDKLAIAVKTIHVSSEPSPEMIDTVVADRQYADIDMVVSVGGGQHP